MKYLPLLLWCSACLFSDHANAQVNCNTVDVYSLPGKWVWAKGGYGNQWSFTEPIRKELQRIMPVALDGLQATNSIAYGNISSIPNTPVAPKQYDCYLQLKKYECLKGYNTLQPEGETGCWVYFNVNTMFDGGPASESGSSFPYYATEGTLLVGEYFIEKDAMGNKLLFANTPASKNNFRGYFFSSKERLPIRRISWLEYIQSYKVFQEKELRSKLNSTREGLQKSEKELTTTQYDDTKQYLTRLIADRKKEIVTLDNKINELLGWFNQIIGHPKIKENARALKAYPDKQDFIDLLNQSDTTTTFPVWVEDAGFYDLSKSKDQPQCILLTLERQDNEKPKKNFMDLFERSFNLDVLAKMVGEAPKQSNGINSLAGSKTSAKTETKTAQGNSASVVINFDGAKEQQFPSGWEGMKNIGIQKIDNKNWLALTQNGFWYPKQFNKEIKDKFSLSVDLRWNKDISYYSGLFTITLSEMEYNNPTQRYRTEDEPAKYWSLYDSYAGNFRRIMLWFDPNWNNGGMLDIYSYDQQETVVKKLRVQLPAFYTANNDHRITVTRKGNDLQVFIDDKLEAELGNAFIASGKYNLYTFSRYKGNNSKPETDHFYINNIKANYE